MNRSRTLLVINPNSSPLVTEEIRESVTSLQAASAHRIECLGLSDGPRGIETQDHIDAVIPLIESCINEHGHDAFVLACFSDPGIRALRHRKYVSELGICSRLAADLPLDLGVADLDSEERTSERLLSVAEALVAKGADVLILGCAGMSRWTRAARFSVENAGPSWIPVIRLCLYFSDSALLEIELSSARSRDLISSVPGQSRWRWALYMPPNLSMTERVARKKAI